MFFKKKNKRKTILNEEAKQRFKQNTFFSKKKKSIFSVLKGLLKISITKKTLNNAIIFGTIFLILGIATILFGPTFKVKTIEVVKKDDLINLDISYDVLGDFRGKSIFLLDKELIKDKLIKSQNNIKRIDINMVLPNKIIITLASNKALFNSKINNSNYLITENGIAVPKSKLDNKLKNIEIKITNGYNDKIISYQKVIDEKYIKSIIEIYNKIEDNVLGIKIDEIKFYSIEREIIIKISNGILLIFSLEGDINIQVEKLIQFNTENKDNINLKNDKISYIDLRIPEKVFLCKKETENICKSNLSSIYGE